MGGGYALIREDYVLWLHKMDVKGLTDYKYFCFNGEPQFIYISKGLENHSTAQISFYSLTGQELDFHRNDYKPYHNAILPSDSDEMLNFARKISTSIGSPFVRIDLYSINKHVYFSEITFLPCSGFIPFDPITADKKLGDLLKLDI
jgi:hypothetical protein